MGHIYNWATRNNDRGRACQKHGFLLEEVHTVKTMLWLSDYLLKQSWVLFFKNILKYETETRPHFLALFYIVCSLSIYCSSR